MIIFGQSPGMRKNFAAGIWVLFRGLNFEHNAEVERKGRFASGSNNICLMWCLRVSFKVSRSQVQNCVLR